MHKKCMYSLLLLTITFLNQASQLKVDVELERSASYMLSPSGKPSEQSDLRSASAMPSASAQPAHGGNQLGFSIKNEIVPLFKLARKRNEIKCTSYKVTGFIKLSLLWVALRVINIFVTI